MKKEENISLKQKEIRITTGTAKNKRLKAPDIEGFRAVQEIAKSSLFSILGEKINNAMCLDLYAGSGNLGIEALSRGAEWCDFVDDNYESTKVIEENLVNCGFVERAEFTRKDVLKFIVNAPRNYDVVFIDPFYKDITHKYLVSNLESVLNEDGIIVFFHGDNLNLEDLITDTNLRIVDERKFGKSYFTLLTL
ncbi:MAG: 16S rRNA (guanine(966)-N(2))-methyltransferase RsmD [Patescibacteria group bacterium]